MIQLIEDDPWLRPYEQDIQKRLDYFEQALMRIQQNHTSLLQYATRHEDMGLHYYPKEKKWIYREWAPTADAVSLIGDFNQWDATKTPLNKLDNGVWEVKLPQSAGIQHLSQYKVQINSGGKVMDRIPAYTRYALQNPETYDFTATIWQPEQPFKWTDNKFKLNKIGAPLIYECHTGMAQEYEGVGTYKDFEENILPRVRELGYNCIQLMAVAEHPYYGSFGYHVSNFFAPSSRFGTPDDLKSLVNAAHNLGIAVIMDLVHSHAVKNEAEGLNNFDGSGHQYFHEGGKGYHEGWDSKLFDYAKEEVERFLLSNVRYWLEEFHFDGFRFDGVTSILYHHHGNGVAFDHYDRYFKDGVDWDAVRYLQLANTLAKAVKKDCLLIGEDMSGMPGLCQPVENGGLGFDFRLGMGIPDEWIKLLKHKRDEDWQMQEIWDVMSNRRYKEKTIAYAESHDQAMVGDKTIAFWLMDKEMYWHMKKDDNSLIIERGLAMHKMIRLITASSGGEAYLNFFGNEFGHPEWLDFPREGNDWSYKYARRQWSLVDNPELKFSFLNAFDQAMIKVLSKEEVLNSEPASLINMDEQNQVLIFERTGLIFIFNFNAHNSIPNYEFWVPMEGEFTYILNSDDKDYGGHGRIDPKITHKSFLKDGEHFLSIYAVNRSAFILKRL